MKLLPYLRPSRRSLFYYYYGAAAGLLLVAVWSLLDPGLARLRSALAFSDPPAISQVKILQTTATTSVISWKTDRDTNSSVNYSVDKRYGSVLDPNGIGLDHKVTLDGLEPSTTYYFRVVSIDKEGNQSISGNYTFVTGEEKANPATQGIANEEQRLLTQKTLALLDKIEDEAALKLILKKLDEQAKENISPPRILGSPDVEVGVDSAVLTWETDKESNSLVAFATAAEFDARSQYTTEQGDSDTYVTNHTVRLTGLRPGTQYHYQLISKGQIGEPGTSRDRTFTTKAVLPDIFSIKLDKVEEHSATISWATAVPASALVEYTNLTTRKSKSLGDPAFTTSHTLRLEGLDFKTAYSVVVRARNQTGDDAKSVPLTFVTTKDEAPPIISRVNNESTVFADVDGKVQTIVTWDTDEPAACQLFYSQGLAEADAQSLEPETNPVLHHIRVITEFAPAQAYKFWVECRDPNGNAAKSENFVLYTPQKEKNIVDIILENFQGTFGWLKNLGI